MLRAIARILAHGFFGKIYISGQPYMGGSCIWASNHTSAIVDPAILFGLSPVKLRPVAKHTLWSHPVMRPLLQNVLAIPVFRAQDMLQKDSEANDLDEKRRKLNQSAFRDSAQALVDGDCLVIFPEGVSHDDPHLHRLRSGTARMALEAVQRADQSHFECVIQPVAIDYFEKDEFRSDLGIYFCQPVVVTDPDLKPDDVTRALEESLREGLAQFETWEDKRNCLFLFETAYGRKPHSPREFRIFQQEHFPSFQAKPDFVRRAQTMRRLLQAMRVEPSQLIWGEGHENRHSFFWMLLSHGLYHFLVCVPIETISTPVWIGPYRLVDTLARLSTRERDVVATMKIAHATYVFLLWCLALSGAFAYLLPPIVQAVSEGEMSFGLAFFCGFVFGVATLLSSLLISERGSFFPGYWKLARLRFLHPRAWAEVMEEWNSFSEAVFQTIEKASEINPLPLRQAR